MAPLQEPVGLWLEGCGGWDDHRPEVALVWRARQEMMEESDEDDSEEEEAAAGCGAPARMPPAVGPAPAPVSQGLQPLPAMAPLSHGWPEAAEVIDLCSDDDSPNPGVEAAGAPAALPQHRQQAEPPPLAAQQQQQVEPPPPAAQQQPPQQQAEPPLPAVAEQQQQQPLAAQARQPVASPLRMRGLQVARKHGPSPQQARAGGAAAAAAGGGGRGADNDPDVGRPWLMPDGHQWTTRGDITGPPPRRPGDLVVLNTVIPCARLACLEGCCMPPMCRHRLHSGCPHLHSAPPHAVPAAADVHAYRRVTSRYEDLMRGAPHV